MKKEAEKQESACRFEGIVSLRAVLAGDGSSRRSITRLFYDREKSSSPTHVKEYAWIKHRAEENGFDIELVGRAALDDMALGSSHGGIIFDTNERILPPLTSSFIRKGGFYILPEGIEDPYNFGYALRSVYAMGADGVLLPPRNWMSAAGVVCRASAGASELMSMALWEDDGARLFKEAGYRIVCADLRDSAPIFDADLKKPLLLVVGGEKRGISRALLEKSDLNVRIDYAREFGASLSAASAATMASYEVMRQNR